MKQNENIACLVVDCCRYVDRSISLEVLNLLSALLMFTVLEGEKNVSEGKNQRIYMGSLTGVNYRFTFSSTEHPNRYLDSYLQRDRG